jgi:hypothetical protein
METFGDEQGMFTDERAVSRQQDLWCRASAAS